MTNENKNPKKKFYSKNYKGKPYHKPKKPSNNNQSKAVVISEIQVGRPCEYETKVKPRLSEVEYWGLLGYSNLKMAEKLDIAESTFYEYQKQFSEFSEAVNKLKPLSNIPVVQSLHRKTVDQYVNETEVVVKELFYKDKESGLEIAKRDDYGNPIIQRITKHIEKVIPADTNAIKFWLVNRDEENWKLKTEVKADTTSKNLNVNANFETKTLSDKDLDEGILELLNVISDL